MLNSLFFAQNKSGKPRLTVFPLSLSFDANGGTKYIYIDSNTGWEISSNVTWIKFDKDSGTGKSSIQVTVTKNSNTVFSRNGTITVNTTNGTITQTVSVSQERGSITIIVGGNNGFIGLLIV